MKGFSRSLGELEWLLLVLVLLYTSVPGAGAQVTNRLDLVAAMIVFTVFVLSFRYLNLMRLDARWKLAIETWAMIAFVTWVLWNTGQINSPLLNLYLLTIVYSALTLGKLATLLEIFLIACVYLFMGYSVYTTQIFSFETFSFLMARFSPFVLVAYLATMLSADIQSAKAKLKAMTETDSVTGLLNRRAFGAILEKEVQQFVRHSRPFAIMMIDADGLKEVNDRMGHDAGDMLIMLVADVIQTSIRASDSSARYGGDEYAVLLSDTESGETHVIGERIRSGVANSSFDVRGQRVSSTVSIGIASCPDDAMVLDELWEKADSALYASKEHGRNRVTVFSEVSKLGPRERIKPVGRRALQHLLGVKTSRRPPESPKTTGESDSVVDEPV